MQFTDQPLEPFGEQLLSVEIENNLGYKMPLIFRLTRLLMDRRCIDPARRELAELCFDEALTNAMVHGNKLDPARKVRAWLFYDEQNWGAIIEDDGEGLRPEDVPRQEDQDLLAETGRGIMLMDNYLDRLVYSRRGNRLMMVRRREAGVPAPAAAAEPVAPVEAPPMLEFEFEEELAVSAVAAPAVLVAPPPTETPAGVARVTTQGDVAVVEVLEERLSDQNVDRFREAMEDAMRRHSKVLVDMSRVSYISSVILGAYARLIRDAQTRKGMLKVCGAGPMVTEVFRSMRFDRLLDLQPDAPSALARMRTT